MSIIQILSASNTIVVPHYNNINGSTPITIMHDNKEWVFAATSENKLRNFISNGIDESGLEFLTNHLEDCSLSNVHIEQIEIAKLLTVFNEYAGVYCIHDEEKIFLNEATLTGIMRLREMAKKKGPAIIVPTTPLAPPSTAPDDGQRNDSGIAQKSSALDVVDPETIQYKEFASHHQSDILSYLDLSYDSGINNMNAQQLQQAKDLLAGLLNILQLDKNISVWNKKTIVTLAQIAEHIVCRISMPIQEIKMRWNALLKEGKSINIYTDLSLLALSITMTSQDFVDLQDNEQKMVTIAYEYLRTNEVPQHIFALFEERRAPSWLNAETMRECSEKCLQNLCKPFTNVYGTIGGWQDTIKLLGLNVMETLAQAYTFGAHDAFKTQQVHIGNMKISDFIERWAKSANKVYDDKKMQKIDTLCSFYTAMLIDCERKQHGYIRSLEWGRSPTTYCEKIVSDQLKIFKLI